ncbi:MAG: efflux RND transporter periplasmic adaptor subunit [Methylobacteriaceae bacterium]|nr:efflux RND transporter periplasmic adaptor subunit [Methylobacteriaceae bacterium]
MKKLARVILTLAIVAAGCVGGYELWNYYMLSPWTRDARVQADVVDIAPDVSGFVSELRVKDNQFVRKGDVLFILDRERYARGLATAQAAVAARKATMEDAEQRAGRMARLTNLSVSDEARQSAVLNAKAAEAAYQEALADLSTAQLNLDRTTIYAPVNGYVTNLTVDVGQYATVGARVLALIDSDSYRVTGYFEETKIPSVPPGKQVEIYLMSGGAPLRGHVVSISRGVTDRDNPSGPDLLANATPTFEWVRLAQRIPVRIDIDNVPEGTFISSGMTATVVVQSPPRQWATWSALRLASQ